MNSKGVLSGFKVYSREFEYSDFLGKHVTMPWVNPLLTELDKSASFLWSKQY